MDERTWSKARNLASAFSEAYDEDVATVLGEALLKSLAGLLVPEDEKPGHWCNPACIDGLCGPDEEPTSDGIVDAVIYCGSTSVDGHDCIRPDGHEGPHIDSDFIGWAGNPVATHPEFLEGEAAYKAAPVGTVAGAGNPHAAEMTRSPEGWRCGGVLVIPSAFAARRPVLRWGPA